jgi:hypothetical protein
LLLQSGAFFFTSLSTERVKIPLKCKCQDWK